MPPQKVKKKFFSKNENWTIYSCFFGCLYQKCIQKMFLTNVWPCRRPQCPHSYPPKRVKICLLQKLKLNMNSYIFWDGEIKNEYKKCFLPMFGPVNHPSGPMHPPSQNEIQNFLLQKLKLNVYCYVFWGAETKDEYKKCFQLMHGPLQDSSAPIHPPQTFQCPKKIRIHREF